MSAAISVNILHQNTTKKKTPLLQYLVNLAEQLVLSERKSSHKCKTNNIGGPRSKRAKAFFNVGDQLPVENQQRLRCARCAQRKIVKRKKCICAAI